MARKFTKTAWVLLVGVVAALTFAGVAAAAVTFDPSCPYTPSNATGQCGFAGKGDVQLALGYNNTQMQKNAGSLAFTYSQPASQALSQDGTQAGTQTGTQSMSQDVSCDLDTGRKTFHRDGTRDGMRAGSRDGSRSGSRTGTVSGNVSYAIAYDARVKNQITGFKLTGATNQGFAASGDPVFGDWSFGDWSFGDWEWGATTWGDWVSESGENPDVCLGGNPGVTNLENTVTPGAIAEGDPAEGDIAEGDIQYGDVTPTGSAHLYVNGKALN